MSNFVRYMEASWLWCIHSDCAAFCEKRKLRKYLLPNCYWISKGSQKRTNFVWKRVWKQFESLELFPWQLPTFADVSVHPIKFILLYSFSMSSKLTSRFSDKSHCRIRGKRMNDYKRCNFFQQVPIQLYVVALDFRGWYT